ncbi:hypothetical protein [Desulfomicrobium baculatum]|nr:hypothetical protein [Desulfomicrobium baculatum]
MISKKFIDQNCEQKKGNGMELLHLQLALIDIVLEGDPLTEYMELKKLIDDKIKILPTILPFINDKNAPPEVPVIQSFDPECGYGINMTRNRVDFMSNKVDKYRIDEFSKYALKIIEKFKNTGIGRIGLISQYSIESENPPRWICEKFLRNEYGVLEEIVVKFNKKEVFDGIQINNLTQFQEALISENGIEKKKVHVLLDINSAQNYTKRTSTSKIANIVKSKIQAVAEMSVGDLT